MVLFLINGDINEREVLICVLYIGYADIIKYNKKVKFQKTFTPIDTETFNPEFQIYEFTTVVLIFQS